MSSPLWQLEPATAAKHLLYQHYFDAWWPILLQPNGRNGRSWPKVTLLDAFAGPGRYEGGEDGSPVFALRRLLEHTAVSRMGLSPGRVQLVFIERQRNRYEHLLAELTRQFGPLDQLPVRVVVRHGEAGPDSERILTEVGAWGNPILGVFDSWGSVNVPLELMHRIAGNPASEVITTFGPNWFSRREDLNADLLDVVFGGRGHWESAAREERSEEKWRAWLASYREALQRAGFGYRLQFQVVPRTGKPLYLVFGTGHKKGVEVMKAAMWKVDRSSGLSFKDPRCRGGVPMGQQSFFESDAIDPELLALVEQRLKNGGTTLEQLGQWLLLETSQWRASDAAKALKELKDNGRIVLPPGRLNRSSPVSLRQ
ncbi:three-Cys-motif partner protein TcmP [Streptomyces sp. NPDC051561]|uniref:three-Cys-motif partner protein TcmP n=1 Tax=Streptomyces sp. NPDC051561 TaxID=3365658 RepID=UPI0037AB8B41